MTKRAVYAGSFDPLTYGHLDILTRAAKLFDEVIVAIGTNVNKKSLFTAGEKETLVQQVLASEGLDNVRTVRHTDDLTVNLAQELHAGFLVRGLRSVKDMEYERDLAAVNKQLDPEIETIFLLATEEYRAVSSSVVKEVAHFKGSLTHLVPPVIAEAVRQKFE